MKVLLCVLSAMMMAVTSHAEDEAKVLRVLSWNLHHGEGVDGKQDLARIAGVIQSLTPDVVVLQEVDNKCKRSGSVDQAAELGRLTGLQFAFGKAMDHDGGEYGQAILSKFPLTDFKVHRLPGEGEPRIAISAQAETALGPVTVAGLHLDYQDAARQTRSGPGGLLRLLAVSPHPVVLSGDFNAKARLEDVGGFCTRPHGWWCRNPVTTPPTRPRSRPTRSTSRLSVDCAR